MIHEVDEGATKFYVFRYTPTTEWLESGSEQSLYSGWMEIYDFSTGNKLNNFEMIEGIEVDQKETNKDCRLELTGDFLCTELYDLRICSYILRESCGGGSSTGNDGGGFYNPTDPNPLPNNPPFDGGSSGGPSNPDNNGSGDGIGVTYYR